MKSIFLTSIMAASALMAVGATAQENASFGQALQTKFQARMTSLNALIDVLEDRLDDAEAYRDGVTDCGNNNMFYMPSKPSADADGCVGFDITTMSGTESINKYATSIYWGPSIGAITTHTISNATFGKMNSGTFQGKFGKAGTMTLSVVKGTPNSTQKTKKWSDGLFGFGVDKCHVTIEYDGNKEIRVGIEGDDGHKKCRGHMQKLDWVGSKLVIK